MTLPNPSRRRSTRATTQEPPDSARQDAAVTDFHGHSAPRQVHEAKPQATNLLLPRSSLIGRDHEVTAVQQLLLQEEVSLLTLTGPGGIGKTRLALQVAANLLDHFVDGVYFVSLAPIRDAALVIPEIAQTLGLREVVGRPFLETLQDYLHYRELLLVLDNFEQVLAATALVAALLTRCRRLKLLVTSRARLHLYGEHELPVPPLALPDAHHLAAGETDLVASLAQVAAVKLFLQRARAAKPDFVLTPTNAAAVVEICIGLDGLPLAIELAAARVKLFPPPALLARLKQRLTLLTGGAHDLPERQRTLRDEIAWSYDLLTAAEQALFRRLAVFVGGFTLAAAQAVGNAAGNLGVAVLDAVAALVDQNLLRLIEGLDGEPRFGMLETIWEYGLEQLMASGEAEATRRCHISFFRALAEEADPKLRGAELASWLQRLEVDDANLRAALAWSLGDEGQVNNQNQEQGVQLAGALSWFWHLRGRYNEGRHWCDRAVTVSDAAEPGPARARALQGAGVAAQMQGDFAHARLCLEKSLALWQKLEDRWGMAYTQTWLALAHSVPGNEAMARPLAEASVALFRALDDSWGIALALNALGSVIKKTGDYATARDLLEESVMRYRLLGDTYGIADSTHELFFVAFDQGDYVTARALMEEGQRILAKQQLIDDKFFRVVALFTLGTFARQEADHQAAMAHFAEGLAVARDAGNQSFVALASQQLGLLAQQQGDDIQATAYLRTSLELSWAAMGQTQNLMSLIGWIAVATHQQQWERAARLAGAVETLRATLEHPLTPLQAADYERSMVAVRERRTEPLVAAAWAHGQTMTLDQAIDYALTLPNKLPSESSTMLPPPALSPPITYPAGLTAREVEVLRLLPTGLTYTQIADTLFISRRTVNAHLTSIYSKLGVTSRAAATRFAVDQHLV